MEKKETVTHTARCPLSRWPWKPVRKCVPKRRFSRRQKQLDLTQTFILKHKSNNNTSVWRSWNRGRELLVRTLGSEVLVGMRMIWVWVAYVGCRRVVALGGVVLAGWTSCKMGESSESNLTDPLILNHSRQEDRQVRNCEPVNMNQLEVFQSDDQHPGG